MVVPGSHRCSSGVFEIEAPASLPFSWRRFTQLSQLSAIEGHQAPLPTHVAIMMMTATMSGAGTLYFPNLFADVGCKRGVGLTCLSCALSAYLVILMTTVIDRVEGKVGCQITKLSDVGLACFGKGGKRITQVIVCTSLLLTTVGYLLTVGQSLNYISDPPAYRGWIVIFTSFFMPFAFLRDAALLRKIAYASVASMALYLIGVIGVSITAGMVERNVGAPPISTSTSALQNIICNIITMTMPFAPWDVMARVRSNMRRPQDFKGVLLLSHVLAMVLPLVAGVAGALGFGPSVQGNMLLSSCNEPGCPWSFAAGGGGESIILRRGMEPTGEVTNPGDKWVFGYVLATAVPVTLALCLTICLFTFFTDIEEHWSIEMPLLPNVSIRAGSLLLSACVGLFVPYWAELLGVVSVAIHVPILCCLPIMFNWKTAKDLQQPEAYWIQAFHVLVFMLGIACLVAGFSQKTWELVDAVVNKNTKVFTFEFIWFTY